MNHVEVMSSSLSPGGQSVSVCVQRWMKEGENSIKAQRCIFHSTNKDKQKPEHVGLCFVSADGSLCVQTAWFDLLRTDWVLQWGLCDKEKLMQQRPLVSRLRITGGAETDEVTGEVQVLCCIFKPFKTDKYQVLSEKEAVHILFKCPSSVHTWCQSVIWSQLLTCNVNTHLHH